MKPKGARAKEDRIALGLVNGEFFVEYQPIVSLGTGECSGAEALLRWRHDGVLVPPSEFIPIAEGTPLIGLLTFFVIEKTIQEIGEWLLQDDGRFVGINVPPELFGRGALTYMANRLGWRDRLHHFMLEVTERGIPDIVSLSGLDYASRSGVKIAIDDIDVHSASLVMMARAKVDIVKLDKPLTWKLTHGKLDSSQVGRLRALFENRNPTVIAEGIETREEADTITAFHVAYGQGWYFSKSLPPEEFLAFAQTARP